MRKLAVGLVVGMALVWSSAFFLVKSYNDSVVKQAGIIVDQIGVPDDWAVLSEHVEREQFICFNNRPCPTFSRTWQADRVLEFGDVQQLVDTVDWEFELDGTCKRGDDAVGMSSVCSVIATSEGYRILLRVDSPEPGAASLLRLRLTSSNG